MHWKEKQTKVVKGKGKGGGGSFLPERSVIRISIFFYGFVYLLFHLAWCFIFLAAV